jgi:hypothetical protein
MVTRRRLRANFHIIIQNRKDERCCSWGEIPEFDSLGVDLLESSLLAQSCNLTKAFRPWDSKPAAEGRRKSLSGSSKNKLLIHVLFI